ncbi:MAG: hypothetical protein V3U35_05210 [Candidatus Neomarinimicrobiota bacterium]
MSQNPTTFRPFRLAFAALLLLAKPGMAQDLEIQWNNYLSADAQVAAASALERGWVAQRARISAEVKRLKARQSWYNGWIIELRIARNSARHVALADSLWQLQARLATLETNRNEAFESLRDHYQRLLLDSDSSARITPSQKALAISVGRQFLGRSSHLSELPDYSFILNRPYDNRALKRIVFGDLQWVIQSKVSLIDSLLEQMHSEAVLAARLDEFQRDLGVQRKSELELSDESSDEAQLASEEGYPSYAADSRSAEFSQSSSSAPGPISADPFTGGPSVYGRSFDSRKADIELLVAKRQQYERFLHQIESELPTP